MKNLYVCFLSLLTLFVLMYGCAKNDTVDNYQDTQVNNVVSIIEESKDEYIPTVSSRKTFVNNCTRGFYYTFDLGEGVEAEYSFNDGVAEVTTYLYNQQFGATETGSYEIYENVLVCNFGHNDVVIEYEISNNDVVFTKIR